MTGCEVRRPPFAVTCGRQVVAQVVLVCTHEHRKTLDICAAHLARDLFCKPCFNAGLPRQLLAVTESQPVQTPERSTSTTDRHPVP